MSVVKIVRLFFGTLSLHIFAQAVSAMSLQHNQTMAMRLLARFNS